MKRPYVCTSPNCKKSYTTRFSLERHVTSHTNLKKHVCVLCFKSFTLAQYLKEHMYIHTGERPFKCTYPGCGCAFRQAGKLSMHRKLHMNILFQVQRSRKVERSGTMALTRKHIVRLGVLAKARKTPSKKLSDSTVSVIDGSGDSLSIETSHKKLTVQTIKDEESNTGSNSECKQQNALFSHGKQPETQNAQNAAQNAQEILLNEFCDQLRFPDIFKDRCLPEPIGLRKVSFVPNQSSQQVFNQLNELNAARLTVRWPNALQQNSLEEFQLRAAAISASNCNSTDFFAKSPGFSHVWKQSQLSNFAQSSLIGKNMGSAIQNVSARAAQVQPMSEPSQGGLQCACNFSLPTFSAQNWPMQIQINNATVILQSKKSFQAIEPMPQNAHLLPAGTARQPQQSDCNPFHIA